MKFCFPSSRKVQMAMKITTYKQCIVDGTDDFWNGRIATFQPKYADYTSVLPCLSYFITLHMHLLYIGIRLLPCCQLKRILLTSSIPLFSKCTRCKLQKFHPRPFSTLFPRTSFYTAVSVCQYLHVLYPFSDVSLSWCSSMFTTHRDQRRLWKHLFLSPRYILPNISVSSVLLVSPREAISLSKVTTILNTMLYLTYLAHPLFSGSRCGIKLLIRFFLSDIALSSVQAMFSPWVHVGNVFPSFSSLSLTN